ncbi:MAG: tetratricopeptide repeat protein [Shewanella sp.]|nr:tetratricopeptide repeat protein [Shewanella sp.]MCF1456820.1 tetratricopeptide repeat protein [Shewanella sp.]
MKSLSSLFSLVFLVFSLPSQAVDVIQDEVKTREEPARFYQEISANLDHLTGDETAAQLSTLAMELGLSQTEMFRKLQLSARLTLEPGVTKAKGLPNNEQMLRLLDTYAEGRYQQALVLMIKGRIQGRDKIRYNEAIALYMEALEMIRHESSNAARALRFTIHDHLSSLNQLIRQYPTAQSHLESLQEVSLTIVNNYLRAYAELSMGVYYNKRGDQARALEHFTQALRLASRDPKVQQLALLNFNLAKVHRDMSNWEDALKRAHEAARGFKQMNNGPYLSHTMTVIAMIYGKQQNWHKAIDYYLNAHQIDVREGNRINQALNMHNLGEAYFKLSDYTNALIYLKGANNFLREKQLNHYLVYNEALLAEVNLAAQNWQAALEHAKLSQHYAEEKKLVTEQIDALAYQSSAHKGLGQYQQAVEVQQAIIAFKVIPGTAPEPAKEDTLLFQQQLKLALSNKDIKIEQMTQKQRLQSRIIIGGAVLLLILLVSLLYMHANRRQLKKERRLLLKEQKQDCSTGHHGCRALMEALTLRQQPATLVLLGLTDNQYPELAKGQHRARIEYKHQLACIDQLPDMRSFALRPGLMAVMVEGQSEGQQLVNRLSETLLLPSLTAGIIPLPLLQSEELIIDAEIQLETVQMALYAAQSLPDNGTPRFVGLHPLDFAPSVIFTHPLYLKLDKSIQRGLIRVSCSGNKTDIRWPQINLADTEDN